MHMIILAACVLAGSCFAVDKAPVSDGRSAFYSIAARKKALKVLLNEAPGDASYSDEVAKLFHDHVQPKVSGILHHEWLTLLEEAFVDKNPEKLEYLSFYYKSLYAQQIRLLADANPEIIAELKSTEGKERWERDRNNQIISLLEYCGVVFHPLRSEPCPSPKRALQAFNLNTFAFSTLQSAEKRQGDKDAEGEEGTAGAGCFTPTGQGVCAGSGLFAPRRRLRGENVPNRFAFNRVLTFDADATDTDVNKK